MEIESIGFAIQTTIVGMLIVFCFLSFLAIVMILLSRIFKVQNLSDSSSDSKNTTAAAHITTANDSGATNQLTDNPEITGVVVAAAAAFVEHEQRSNEASAAQWSGIASDFRANRHAN